MKTKLTLVSIYCNGRRLQHFLQLPIVNNKPFLSYETMDNLFYHHFGWVPERGQTFSIGC